MKSNLYLSKLCLLLILVLNTLVINAQQTSYTKKQVLLDGQLIEQYEPNNKKIADVPINAALLAAGDDCNDPIGVTVNGATVQKSLIGATYSGIMPPCATSSNIFDTWFVTQADANGSLNIGFDALNNEDRAFGITLWTDCTGNADDMLSCHNAPIQFSGLLYSPDRLNPNQTIYVQVWTYEASSQDVIVESASYCNILFGPTTVGDQTCISGTGKYNQSVSVAYYTILEQNPTIRVVDHTFTEVYAVQATTNPQMITIPDLPANGVSQTYYIGLGACFSPFNFEWQAPNDDCTSESGGITCPAAINLLTDNPNEICWDLNNSDISTSIPYCSNPELGAIKSVWFKAVADNIGSLTFDYVEKNYNNITVGYAVYDACQDAQQILCYPPPTFNTSGFRVSIPESARVPNKEWYLQLWTYTNQEQEVCVRAFPDCGFTDATLGTATCTSEQTFNQEVTLFYFNLPDGKIQVISPDDNFSLLYETDVTSSPQVLTIPNLPTTLTRFYFRLSNSDCNTRSINDLSVPSCTGSGNSCPETLIIDTNSDLSLQEHRAATTITTEGEVSISSATSFKAGTSITLKAGFQVNSGIDFSAIIEDCPDASIETPTEGIARIAPSSPLTIIKESSLSIYPNPFTSYATIEYHLPTAGKVDLQVVDFMGRQVAVLEDQTIKSAGNYQYNFQPNNLVSGTYFVVLRSEGHYEVKKILALNKR